jgi:tetratricopeptide (TPR) repeat protein
MQRYAHSLMPSGDASTLFLTLEHLEASLDSLIYVSKSKFESPLRYLMLVDEVLRNPFLPSSHRNRDYALRELLVELITSEYDQRRTKLGLGRSDPNSTLEQSIDDMNRCGAIRKRELSAWAVIYYRFARAEFDFGQADLAVHLLSNERDIRRNIDLGVDQLFAALITAEAEARARQKRLHLLGSMPAYFPNRIVGERRLVSRLAEQLAHTPLHVCVAGVAGVGKTTFVQNVLYMLIEADIVDHVVWCNGYHTLADIESTLHDRLRIEEGALTLQATLQVQRVFLIIDHFDGNLNSIEFATFLKTHPALTVVWTVQAHEPTEPSALHIRTAELERDDAHQFAQRLLSTQFDNAQFIDAASKWMVDTFGGNPTAIQLAAARLHYETYTEIAAEVFSAFYTPIINHLTPNALHLWLIAAIAPHGRIEHALAVAFFSDEDRIAEARHTLLNLHLAALEPATQALSVPHSAFNWVKLHLATNAVVESLVQRSVEMLDIAVATHPRESYTFVMNLLRADWLVLDEVRQSRWLDHLWHIGYQAHHWHEWERLLAIFIKLHPRVSASLWLRHAVFLRGLGRVDESIHALNTAVELAGNTGDFAIQALALCEYAVLYRHQARYAVAEEALKRASNAATRQQNLLLIERITCERAQIFIDQNKPKDALGLIASMNSLTAEVLRAECYFMMHDFSRAQTIVDLLANQQGDNRVLLAKLYTLGGQMSAEKGQYQEAYLLLSNAITLFEQAGDVFSLSRARNNLAVVLAQLGKREMATQLLQQAQHIHDSMQDRVGRWATRHNLRWLAEETYS